LLDHPYELVTHSCFIGDCVNAVDVDGVGVGAINCLFVCLFHEELVVINTNYCCVLLMTSLSDYTPYYHLVHYCPITTPKVISLTIICYFC
jgi:hypothetical protein